MSANSTEQIAGAGEAREHPAGNGVVVLLVVTALLVLTHRREAGGDVSIRAEAQGSLVERP